MVDYNAPLYQFPQETWDAATCAKLAKHTAKDGLGTPYPFKGYLGCPLSCPPRFGAIRYNGGCTHDGQWYQGEFRPLPRLPAGYRIVTVPTWGWRLIAEAA
jgi:hypothetical protein